MRLIGKMMMLSFSMGMAFSASPIRQGAMMKRPSHMTDSQAVDLYTLRNSKGAEAKITTYGGHCRFTENARPRRQVRRHRARLRQPARITRRRRPISAPSSAAMATGLPGANSPWMAGNTPWRTTIMPNALHGGILGFDKVVWEATVLTTRQGPTAETPIHQQGRRRRIPRQPQRHRHL